MWRKKALSFCFFRCANLKAPLTHKNMRKKPDKHQTRENYDKMEKIMFMYAYLAEREVNHFPLKLREALFLSRCPRHDR